MAVKQVIVLRDDLHMRKGKMCAQSTHTVKKMLFDLNISEDPSFLVIPLDAPMQEWVHGLFTAIVARVSSEEELLNIYQQALDAGLHCSLIQDAGHTEFHGVPTYTAVAIGPNEIEEIDKITGNLKLL